LNIAQRSSKKRKDIYIATDWGKGLDLSDRRGRGKKKRKKRDLPTAARIKKRKKGGGLPKPAFLCSGGRKKKKKGTGPFRRPETQRGALLS